MAKNNLRDESAKENSTILTGLIEKYIRGEIAKEKTKGWNLPREAPMSVFLRGASVLSLCEEFSILCKKELRDPSEVMVKLINLYAREN